MLIDAEQQIRKELDPNEELIWNGMPRQGIIFRSADIFMIPFSIFWGGFAIFWEISVLTMPNEESSPIAIIFPLFGIPFVLVGLYIMFGRFIFDMKVRTKTFYALTNERIIIISGLFSKTVRSLNLATLTDISLKERHDKSGTITFGQEHPFSSMYEGMHFPVQRTSTPKFEAIEDAKDLYNSIRNAQNNTKSYGNPSREALQ